MLNVLKLFSCFVFTSTAALAHDDHMTRITGPEIDLKMVDHGLAGSIKNKLVMGFQIEEEFGSNLIIREGWKVAQSQLRRVENRISASAEHVDAEGVQHHTTFEFVKIDRATATITVKLNEELVDVQITADDFRDNHFINPVYRATVSGQQVEFKVEDGHACYGCSVNIIYMILTAFVH